MSEAKSYSLPLKGWDYNTKVFVGLCMIAVFIFLVSNLVRFVIRGRHTGVVFNILTILIPTVLLAAGLYTWSTPYGRGIEIDTDRLSSEMGVSDMSLTVMSGQSNRELNSRYHLSFQDSRGVRKYGYLLVKKGTVRAYVVDKTGAHYTEYGDK